LITELIKLVGIVTSLENELTGALWALHSYVFEMFTYTPRLVLQSRETGCGKTVLMELLERLTDHGYKVDETTPAAMYRRLKQERTTYLLDEAEHSDILSEKRFKALFNMGYQGGRAENANAQYVAHFALAVALVVSPSAWLSPQALRRSIILEMTKNAHGYNKVKNKLREITLVQCLFPSWAATFSPPEEIPMPARLSSDACNNWKPLIAVADSLGYGTTARALALALDRRIEDPVAKMMLDSIRIFQQLGDHIWTEEYLKTLHDLEDSAWDEYRGASGVGAPHKLTRTELYDLLDVKLIKSKSVWKGKRGAGGKCARGFERAQFEPVWSAMGVTPAQPSKIISLPRHGQRHGAGTPSEE
jgi:uncharacterized protein DUF3631